MNKKTVKDHDNNATIEELKDNNNELQYEPNKLKNNNNEIKKYFEKIKNNLMKMR